MKQKSLFIVMLLLIWMPLPTQAGKLYRWVDESGQTHFSQIAPKEEKAKNLTRLNKGDKYSDLELDQATLNKLCDKVEDSARQIAQQMRSGYSAQRALTRSHSDAKGILSKQLIGFVYGFRQSKITTQEIASIAHTQCQNGSYNRYVARYMDEQGLLKNPNNKASTADATSFGTGWPIGQGLVVTNAHVLAFDKGMVHVITSDGTKLKASVFTIDRGIDIALLRVEDKTKLPPSLAISSDSSEMGTEVFTIGYPYLHLLGSEPKLTTGVISSVSGLKNNSRHYQISVPIQSGNSGGPLLNMNGKVVGIVTAKLNAVKVFESSGDLPQNVNYAIKSEVLTDFLASRSIHVSLLAESSLSTSGSLRDLARDIKKSVMIVVSEGSLGR